MGVFLNKIFSGILWRGFISHQCELLCSKQGDWPHGNLWDSKNMSLVITSSVTQARKTLLVPTPRLRAGLFNKIVPPSGATKEILRICATSQVGRTDERVCIDLWRSVVL